MDVFVSFDLNLLRTLDALLREKSVSRAAQRVGLSQPAMSHALARLRTTLGDPLLVRSGREMVLTPRAEALRERVVVAMDAARAVLDVPEDFSPASLRGQVTILTNDYAELTVLPEVVGRLAARAPGLDVVIRSVPATGLEEALGSGEGDLAVLIGESRIWPQGLHLTRHVEDPFVCVVRAGHPALDAGLDLDAYCTHPHVLVSRRGDRRGVVDEFLRRAGRERRVAWVVPAFQLAPAIVQRSDAILTVNRGYVAVAPQRCSLVTLPPPIELPVGSVATLWHPRTHRDPAQRWVRGEIAEAARRILDDARGTAPQ